MSGILAAALGGAAGGLALVGIAIVAVVLCLWHRRRTSDSSESSSSGSHPPDLQGARCLTLEELRSATRNFSSLNFIGHGMFGEVLIVCSTFLGMGQAPGAKIEFKQRLSIAHGTAKGLSHLHSLTPPAIHMNFKTANVLVDEDYIPKVADTGIPGLLDRLGGAGLSSRTYNNPFVDPRFGVFLVELVSGRSAASDQSIIQWVQNFQESSDLSAIADDRIRNGFTSESMKELLRLTSWCMNPMIEQRPSMSLVEAEIHRIREQEIRLTSVMTEGIPTVTLGSQLFRTSR
ncbi:hypothetical protein PR202_gb03876 [Eleusine coracana subsp. coracana]|uniref:non-specific serine/threonine protein kinase n=1 Tax=Eleusine coracana subsp. coracana TaxID=191504 RepID=A0AAV5E2A4_ELECO|nr:hypothetical protein PR202_gb03876 [Eleusine coracana subsp. coracana]